MITPSVVLAFVFILVLFPLCGAGSKCATP
jgi:hypothetical protein